MGDRLGIPGAVSFCLIAMSGYAGSLEPDSGAGVVREQTVRAGSLVMDPGELKSRVLNVGCQEARSDEPGLIMPGP